MLQRSQSLRGRRMLQPVHWLCVYSNIIHSAVQHACCLFRATGFDCMVWYIIQRIFGSYAFGDVCDVYFCVFIVWRFSEDVNDSHCRSYKIVELLLIMRIIVGLLVSLTRGLSDKCLFKRQLPESALVREVKFVRSHTSVRKDQRVPVVCESGCAVSIFCSTRAFIARCFASRVRRMFCYYTKYFCVL